MRTESEERRKQEIRYNFTVMRSYDSMKKILNKQIRRLYWIFSHRIHFYSLLAALRLVVVLATRLCCVRIRFFIINIYGPCYRHDFDVDLLLVARWHKVKVSSVWLPSVRAVINRTNGTKSPVRLQLITWKSDDNFRIVRFSFRFDKRRIAKNCGRSTI